MTAPEERALAGALTRMGEHIRRQFHAAVAAHGMNPPQAAILRYLDEPLAMGAIADRLFVDASYVTGLVDRLEDLGFVERRPDPSDRRIKQVAMTAAGRRARDVIRASFVDTAAPFEHLDAGEQAQLLRLLEKAFPE